MKELGNRLSTSELSQLRERVEKILEEEKKRVLVVMDDIDRLDKSEVHAILKLIKLSADFAYTSYILAFDEPVDIIHNYEHTLFSLLSRIFSTRFS